MAKAAMGARVMFCGHEGYFVADIFKIGNVNAVNASAPVSGETLIRDNRLGKPTHHISDFPVGGMWHPRKGVFVVPAKQVRELK